jgi:aarF domain-containing kinase
LVLKTFAKVFSILIPRGRFLDPLVHWYEFSSLLLSQLNLVREAENLLEFRYNFRDFSGVAFPSPVMELCSPDVLVESFEEGYPLQKTQPSKALADLGVKMFLKMLFEDNFVHADLHPGNLLVRIKHADGSVGLTKVDHRDKNELVVLDPGLVTSLSPKDRENFLLLFSAVACGNSELASNMMLERSPYQACKNPDEFRADMKRIFHTVAPTQGQDAASANSAESLHKNGFRLADVKLGDVLTDILNTMRHHEVTIDGHFATLVMTVVVGEGLGRIMHPNYNLFAAAAPYLVNSLSGSEMDALVTQLRATYGITELASLAAGGGL